MSSLPSSNINNWKHIENEVDLTECQRLIRQEIASDSLGRLCWVAVLGVSYENKYELTGDETDLQHSIRLTRESLSVSHIDKNSRADRLNLLARLMMHRYNREKDSSDLDVSVAIAEEVLASTLELTAVRLYNLSFYLRRRYYVTKDQGDLERAIHVGKEALSVCQPDDGFYSGVLCSLGESLHLRFGVSGALADIQAVVALEREALSHAKDSDRFRCAYLDCLSSALVDLYVREKKPEYLEEAVSLSSRAVVLATAGEPRANSLCMLLYALYRRFEKKRSLKDLMQTIRVSVKSLGALSDASPSRPVLLVILSMSLVSKYELTRDQRDLEDAIILMADAYSSFWAENLQQAEKLNEMAIWYDFLYEKTAHAPYFDTAIRFSEKSLMALPDLLPGQCHHINRAHCLANLARLLGIRYDLTGQQADLQKAIECITEAMTATPPDHHIRPRLINLANHLAIQQQRAENGVIAEELEAAIRDAREANLLSLESDDEQPLRPHQLERLLSPRFENGMSVRVLKEATDLRGLRGSRRVEDIDILG
jgi:tetratricopeptide (TPR) repeat protein